MGKGQTLLDTFRGPTEELQRLILGSEEAAIEYRRLRDALWNSLVVLHNTVSVVEDYRSYPHYFLSHARATLNLLILNSYDIAVLAAVRTWDDPDHRSVSLADLRRHVMRHAKEQERKAIQGRLAVLRPSAELNAVIERLQDYRNKRLGHHDREEFDREPQLLRYPGTLKELRDVQRLVEDSFNALGIGVHAEFGMVGLSRHQRGDSDTVRMLDAIGLQHPDVRDVDERSEWWKESAAERMTPPLLAFLTALRRKYGLSDPPPTGVV